MKQIPVNRPLALGAAVLLAAVTAPNPASATDYTWKGTLSSSWGTSGNWLAPNGMGPTNGAFPHRLNVYNAAASPLVYTEAEGTTTYGTNGIRGLVVGSGTTGTMTITGGTFITAAGSGGDIVGNVNGITGILNISGGNYICNNSLSLGLGGGAGRQSHLNINSGTCTLPTLTFNSTLANLNLNGGTLSVSNIVQANSGGLATTNNFNGGTLQARTTTLGFFPLAPNAVVVCNVRDGGAIIDTAGFDITMAQPLRHSVISGDLATDGGLTKNGNGTLTLSGTNTYTGPTVVNQGSLSMKLPSSSASLTLADGAAASIIVNDSSWTTSSVNVTNATLNLSFGSVFALPASIIPATALNASGANVINITSGAGLPVGETKLIDHGGNKIGGGTFTLGTLPPGMQASLLDGPTSVSLMVVSSVQALVWSGTYGTDWATNGSLNWNNGTAAYQEYVSGVGDIVTFSDAAGFFYSVTIPNDVKPLGVSVEIPTASVTISGPAGITGGTGLSKSGGGILSLVNANSYDGVTTVSSGTLQVLNGAGLGSTVGGTVVSGTGGDLSNSGVLAIGDGFGSGVVVSGETVSLGYATGSAALARGALRGVDSGNNVWAGPVIVAGNQARIGTEDGAFLEVSGTITDNGTGNQLILRPGAGGTVVISGSGSSYGTTKTFGDLSGTGIVKLGANNAFSTNALDVGKGVVDLNGSSQTISGLIRTDSNGPGIVRNDGASPSVLTFNTGTNTFSSDVDIVDGASSVSIVKQGSGKQTLNAANLTYTGATLVNEGVLHLATPGIMNSTITVASGATLGGEATNISSLTLNANSALIVDPSTPGSITANTINAGTGPIQVTFVGGFSGDALVLSAPGGITGSAANFQAVGGRGGNFYLANANTELYFHPLSASLVWTGNDPVNPTFWDVEITTNWLNAGLPDAFFTGDNVQFDDTASSFVVAPQGTVQPSSVVFNNSISNYTVSGVIGGGTLTKSGSALLKLTGNNSYNGETHVNGGTVVVENNNALGSKVGGTTISSGGTLDLGGALPQESLNLGAEVLTVSGTGVGGNGAVVNNSSVSQFNAVQRMVLAGDATVGGSQRWDLRGTGNWLDMGGHTLTKAGSNYIALVGTLLTNTPGHVVVQGGTFAIQQGADLGGSAANTLTLADGAIVNNYQTTPPQNWTLIMGSNSMYEANVGVAGQNIWAGPVTVNSTAILQINSYVTISGNITGAGSITKTGSGIVVLSGANSYSGPTTLSSGRLYLDGSQSSPVSAAANTILGGAGTLGGAVTLAGSSRLTPGSATGVGTLTAASLTLSNGTTVDFEFQDTVTYDQVAVTASGGLTFGQVGINLYVSGTTTAFSDEGTYTLFTYAGALNGNVGDLTVLNPQSGKTYTFSADGANVQVTIGTAPAPIYWGVDNNGSWGDSGNWSPANVPSGQFATANIGGVGSPVTFTAPHAITLDGTYTLGALVLETDQPFTINQGASGQVQFDNGSGAALISENTGSHTINAPLAVSAKGLNLSVATSTTLAINGDVSGTGGLSKIANGTLVLGGASTYSGVTAVSAGTVVVSHNAAFGSTLGGTVLSTGTTNNVARVELANGVVVSGESITINGYGQNVRGSLQAASGATAEWAGPVILGGGAAGDGNRVGAAANGTLKISGPITNGTIADLHISADGVNGKVIVSGANTFTGKAGIIRGTLELGANDSLPATAPVDVHSASSVADVSIFEMAGYNQLTAGLLRSGNGGASMITNSAASMSVLTISNAVAYSYPGYLGGAIALVKDGSGTQTFTAATTYTGDTTVNAGTLVMGQPTLSTNSTVSIATNAVLQLNFVATNTVAALVLNGTNQPAGVYDSVTAAPYIIGTGALLVPSELPPIPTVGTNLVYTVADGGITLSWPSEYTGWTLQSQTNALETGLSGNWITVQGSEATNTVTLQIDAANPAVFFRMVYTNTP